MHWRIGRRRRYRLHGHDRSEESGRCTGDGDYPFVRDGRRDLRIDQCSSTAKLVLIVRRRAGRHSARSSRPRSAGMFECAPACHAFQDFDRRVGPVPRTAALDAFIASRSRVSASDTARRWHQPSTSSSSRASRSPFPPLDEQRRIVAYLDEQTAKIDALIAETERFIELARERRSALITAAVTGQIDVREMA